MECRVEFEYTAQESDELSLKKGDIITNVLQKMDGWWEGTLHGKTGMFPDNFVKVIPTTSNNTSGISGTGDTLSNTKDEVKLRKTSLSNSRRLKALFSYAPEQEDELRLDVGDIVDFLSEVEEGWWRGKLKGRIGIFPSNFVKDFEASTNGSASESVNTEEKPTENVRATHGKVIPDNFKTERLSVSNADDDPAPELPPKPVREIGRCYYPYQALNEDELELKEGDIITIISKNCEDEGWWRGELRGKTGLFPDNFVKIVSPNDPVINISNSTASSQPQKKILAQERNVSFPGAETPAPIKEPAVATSVVDGVSGSKITDKEKVAEGRPKFISNLNKLNLKDPPASQSLSKIIVGTPPSSPATIPPPVIVKQESKKDIPIPSPKRESIEDMGDFNAVERTEKLSHPTANRAKAPKRRPPSTIVTRDTDNDISAMNGSMHSPDSPPAHHSTPFNLSHNTSNGTATNLPNSVNSTPSNSVHDGPSLSHSNSLLSPKETSMNSNASVNSGVSKTIKTPPWMAELRSTQDKKREKATGPNITTSVNNTLNTSTPSTLPSPTLTTPQPSPVAIATAKEKDPAPLPGGVTAKAPPLPAKPSNLPSFDKSSNITPVSSANKYLPKKPSPPVSGTNNYMNSNSHSVNEAQADSQLNTKPYVSYEEHAKLRERVSSLENELETMKRQLKILLDRELHQGHIV